MVLDATDSIETLSTAGKLVSLFYQNSELLTIPDGVKILRLID
jgi:hypothetical protein